MKVLITGSDGMVGSRLAKYLQRREHYVQHFEGDVTVWADWEKYGNVEWDFVIHLAALAGVRPSFDDPEKYYHNNVMGTQNALEFGAYYANKMLYASSSNAYEWWGNPYAATKKMNEFQAMGSNAIGMRFHTIWPGRPDMLFRKFERDEVTYINRGHYRDFIHIFDLLDGIYTIMMNYDKVIDNHPVVDIGTGHSTPVEEVAKIMGFEGEYRDANPQGERVHTKANVEYLLNLGWTPTHNILNKDHHVDYK